MCVCMCLFTHTLSHKSKHTFTYELMPIHTNTHTYTNTGGDGMDVDLSVDITCHDCYADYGYSLYKFELVKDIADAELDSFYLGAKGSVCIVHTCTRMHTLVYVHTLTLSHTNIYLLMFMHIPAHTHTYSPHITGTNKRGSSSACRAERDVG
jgi:hypothetical protein